MTSRRTAKTRALRRAPPRKRAKRRDLDRLGRRPGDNPTRDEILDAAEKAFAANGYAGTSLRAIAATAGVNSALVQYYFKSKEGLFNAIFLRRGHELAQERMELLDALERRNGPPPTVAEIVSAFLKPAFNLKRRGAGGTAFMQLQARLQLQSEASRDIRTSVYEESMQRCIRALCRALPDLEPNAVFWRITFMVGAYFHTISDANRLEVVSDGRFSSGDLDEAFRQLVRFFVGGLMAPASD